MTAVRATTGHMHNEAAHVGTVALCDRSSAAANTTPSPPPTEFLAPPTPRQRQKWVRQQPVIAPPSSRQRPANVAITRAAITPYPYRRQPRARTSPQSQPTRLRLGCACAPLAKPLRLERPTP